MKLTKSAMMLVVAGALTAAMSFLTMVMPARASTPPTCTNNMCTLGSFPPFSSCSGVSKGGFNCLCSGFADGKECQTSIE